MVTYLIDQWTFDDVPKDTIKILGAGCDFRPVDVSWCAVDLIPMFSGDWQGTGQCSAAQVSTQFSHIIEPFATKMVALQENKTRDCDKGPSVRLWDDLALQDSSHRLDVLL
eukprot:jgi/Ulvmu1/4511/UM002_0237.1